MSDRRPTGKLLIAFAFALAAGLGGSWALREEASEHLRPPLPKPDERGCSLDRAAPPPSAALMSSWPQAPVSAPASARVAVTFLVATPKGPVARASLRVHRRGSVQRATGKPSWESVAGGVTDERGEWVLALAPGRYVVSAQAQPYAAQRELLEVPGGVSTMLHRIGLEAGSLLWGRVVEKGTNVPVPLAEVRLASLAAGEGESALPDDETVVLVSDAHGLFRGENLAEGRFRVEARAVGYAPTVHPEVVLPTPEELRLELVGTSYVTGFVLAPDGGPAPSAEVLISDGSTVERAVTGLGGGFSAEVSPGRYEVLARRGAEAGRGEGRVQVEPKETAQVRVQLWGGSGVRGVVRDSSRTPVGQAVVSVHPAGGLGLLGQTVTSPDGRFVVGGLPQGPLLVQAKGPRGEARLYTAVPAGKEVGLELALRGRSRLTGQVVDPPGSPVVGARVSLSRRWPPELPDSPSVLTDANGAFDLGEVAPGGVRLQATLPNSSRLGQAHVIVREGQEAFARIELLEGGTLRGRVRSTASLRPEAMVVQLARLGSGATLAGLRQTGLGADGTYELLLEPGSYQVSAHDRAEEVFVADGKSIVTIAAGQTSTLDLAYDAAKPKPKRTFPIAEPGTLGVAFAQEAQTVALSWVAGGGPGSRAGLSVGDVLLEVDGQPVQTADQAYARTRGEPGSVVQLKVRRGQAALALNAQREFTAQSLEIGGP